MYDILLVSGDTLFRNMIALELKSLFLNPCLTETLDEASLSDKIKEHSCRLLILDLDASYPELDRILDCAIQEKLPVILFGYPDSALITPEKMRYYDSDIYRYVFLRPFLMEQFLFCVRELLHYRAELVPQTRDNPPMQMKRHCPADDIHISESERTVFYKNTPVPLTHSEFDILLYLMHRRGKAISRSELMDVIGHDTAAENSKKTNIVDVYIRYIRAKIDEPFQIKLIETVRGCGYTIRKQSYVTDSTD